MHFKNCLSSLQVFISCSIIICEANNPNTRCSQGCTNNPVPPPPHHHHKREAAVQTGSHFISQGPLRLRRATRKIRFACVVNAHIIIWHVPHHRYYSHFRGHCKPRCESEPCCHHWLSPSSGCHGVRSGHLQIQDVKDHIPALAITWVLSVMLRIYRHQFLNREVYLCLQYSFIKLQVSINICFMQVLLLYFSILKIILILYCLNKKIYDESMFSVVL